MSGESKASDPTNRPSGHSVPTGMEGGEVAGTPGAPPPEPSHAERCRTLVAGSSRGASVPHRLPAGPLTGDVLMRQLFLVGLFSLVVLVGCSKNDPTPQTIVLDALGGALLDVVASRHGDSAVGRFAGDGGHDRPSAAGVRLGGSLYAQAAQLSFLKMNGQTGHARLTLNPVGCFMPR